MEALRALKLACDNVGLGKRELEGIFFRNAEDLYGLPGKGNEHGRWAKSPTSDSALLRAPVSY